jgi:uncharacterized glyoxalase superfamily protein PhnB
MTHDPFDALRLTDVVPRRPPDAFADDLRRRLRSAAADLLASPTTGSTAMPTLIPTLIPYLIVSPAAEAIAFYVGAFEATEASRWTGDDGRVGHCELHLGDAVLYLADEYPEMGLLGPTGRGGTTVSLALRVADTDAAAARSAAAGAVIERGPADQPYGERGATIVDPFGHRWMLSTPIAGFDPTADSVEVEGTEFTITRPDD